MSGVHGASDDTTRSKRSSGVRVLSECSDVTGPHSISRGLPPGATVRVGGVAAASTAPARISVFRDRNDHVRGTPAVTRYRAGCRPGSRFDARHKLLLTAVASQRWEPCFGSGTMMKSRIRRLG